MIFKLLICACVSAIGKGASSLAGDYDYEWNHSLYVPFVAYDGQNIHWNVNALVNMYSYIRLTNDAPDQHGSVWSRTPLTSPNWFIDLSVNIAAKNERNAGDGLALWFVEEPLTSNADQLAFGANPRFNGLGIFIDLYPNSRHDYSFPRISAMINDGSRVFDNDTDGKDQVMAACTPPSSLLHLSLFKMRVLYAAKRLEILMQLDPHGPWSTCFIVQYVNLPAHGFIGVTARTGSASARMDISGLVTATISPSSARMFWTEPPRRLNRSFTVLIFISLAGLIAWLAWRFYQKQNRFKNHVI